MRDWTEYVDERLRQLWLPQESKQEIAAEIAGHLEELTEAHMLAGRSDEEACQLAVQEVSDWRIFRREVQKAKETVMTNWLRRIVVPGMVGFVFAGWFDRFLFGIRVWPRMLHFGKYGWVTFNWVWLVAVVVGGGLSAYLSRRAGGSTRQRVVATLFPVAGIGAFFILMASATLLWRAAMGNVGIAAIVVLEGMGGYLTGFAVIPATALMLGALPFLGGDAAPEQTRPTSSTPTSA